jgi:creatinine amidohydrolase
MEKPKEKPLYISLMTDLPYAYSAGRSLSRFLVALRDEEKFLASRCNDCQLVLLPPRLFCTHCHKKMADYVEVGPGGTLETFSVINFGFIDPFTGTERPVPYGYGIVRLDGCSTLLPHFLDVSDHEKLAIGQRVEAVFEPREKRTGAFTDVKYFRVLLSLLLLLISSTAVMAQTAADTISTWEMNRINWMEFKEVVPSKINTVILPTGTLEPHGVTANGSDNIAPEAIARKIAPAVKAMIAPTVPYGMTGSMSNYPGAFQISESAYRPYLKEIIEGLVATGFKNIIIMNGHGGPQTAVLQAVAGEVANGHRGVRTLVINWWSYTSEITKEVFGQDGGHAGLNENAFMLAIDPALVHQKRYSPDMAIAYPAPATAWAATPFPSSIGLYQKGQGYPDFDQKKAQVYFDRVTQAVAELIKDMIRRWDAAGV